MNLIIVESPTKARTLSRFLGEKYNIEPTMGHIKDLPKNQLAVDIENNFEPRYVMVEKKKDTVKKIKDVAKKSSQIYLATDPDREGEAIAQHVYELLIESIDNSKGKKQTLVSNPLIQRIVFHEITKEAVEKAIKSPRNIDANLVDAQIARRVLDRLVGYKLSPLLWKKVRRGLSAGRVQSVAVRLIVEREREIEAFLPEEYWDIWVLVKRQKDLGEEFKVKLIKIDGKGVEIKDELSSEKVVSDLRRSSYKVIDLRKREIHKSPYPPFTTSTITQSAARIFGWSAKKTMNIAQKLYEEGLITYHRTDSVNLATSAVEKARKFILENYGKNYLPERPRFFKVKSKLAQEAHEAIRPTDINSRFELRDTKYIKEGQMLYDLIWKRFIACQMEDCILDETVIDVLATPVVQSVNSEYLLRASGQIVKFDGWTSLRQISNEKKKDEEESILPEVEKGESLSLIKVLSEQKFTQPPPRYNEASLIKNLERLGIGRPSTYAPIITTIQQRNYVEKREGKFWPTAIGIAVNDFLVANFPHIVDYSFTAQMENELDEIAKGERKRNDMLSEFYFPFEKQLNEVTRNSKRVKIEVERLGRKCPTCEKEGRKGKLQGELVIRTGRFGKFISCSLFPECKHTEKYIEKLDVTCPGCRKGEVIVKTTKRGKKFYGCSRYPKCEWASWKKPLVAKNILEKS